MALVLPTKPEHNGRKGTVTSWTEQTGHLVMRIDGIDGNQYVKPSNEEELPPEEFIGQLTE